MKHYSHATENGILSAIAENVSNAVKKMSLKNGIVVESSSGREYLVRNSKIEKTKHFRTNRREKF